MVRIPVYCEFLARTSDRKFEQRSCRLPEDRWPVTGRNAAGSCLNLGVEIRSDGARGRGKTGDGSVDLLAAILKVAAADQERRQKYRSQHQQQQSKTNTHKKTPAPS